MCSFHVVLKFSTLIIIVWSVQICSEILVILKGLLEISSSNRKVCYGGAGYAWGLNILKISHEHSAACCSDGKDKLDKMKTDFQKIERSCLQMKLI